MTEVNLYYKQSLELYIGILEMYYNAGMDLKTAIEGLKLNLKAMEESDAKRKQG